MKSGDIIEAKAPKCSFHIDSEETCPAVLIAAGVGITPMISMVNHVLNEGVRTRHRRNLTVMHAARLEASDVERALHERDEEIANLKSQMEALSS